MSLISHQVNQVSDAEILPVKAILKRTFNSSEQKFHRKFRVQSFAAE